jgi:LysR family glycine cleavage system transcriptional activator
MNTKDLPPLNPLHVFDVAARVGSFAQAATELNVTQSAVSRQIATLEGSLGVRLFERERRGLSLTSAGNAYWREVTPAFAIIAAATQRVKRDVRLEPLRIRVYATFAMKWLIKRLPDFETQFPGITVQMSTIVAPVNFAREDVDLAIQLGRDNGQKAEVIKLFPDIIQPVCSPKLLRERPIETLDDLRHHRLLHSRYRRRDWPDWLHAVGRKDLLKEQDNYYPNSLLAYEAAAKGIGVVIGQIRLLGDDFADGTLVPLFDRPIDRGLAYYAAWSKDREPDRKVRVFVSWLRRSITESAATASRL